MDYIDMEVLVEVIDVESIFINNSGMSGWIPKNMIENYHSLMLSEGNLATICINTEFLEQEGWLV
jgi:hypothetical protein